MQVRAWIVLAVLALAVPAGAQQASFSVGQSQAPASLETEAGSSTSFDVAVNITGEGFSCAAEVEAPVNTTVEASVPSSAPDNASVTPTDASLAFAIPAGDYHTEAYNDSATATIDVETDSGVSEDYTATLSVTSVFPGGMYTDCLPQEFPEAQSEALQVELDVTADQPADQGGDEDEQQPEEEPEDNTTQPPTNETPGEEDNGEEDNGIPLPWPLVPASLAAVAVVSRRLGSGS